MQTQKMLNCKCNSMIQRQNFYSRRILILTNKTHTVNSLPQNPPIFPHNFLQLSRTRPAELKIHNQFPGGSASLSTMQRASRRQNLTACSDYVHSLPDQTTICKYKKIIVNSQWLPKHKKNIYEGSFKKQKNIHRFIMFSLNHMFIDIFMFSQIISS